VEPWWEALFECVVFALGALWIVDGMIRGSWFEKSHIVFLPLLLLALYALAQSLTLWGATTNTGLALQSAISFDPYSTRGSFFKLLALTLAGVLLLRYTSTDGRLRALVFTLIGVGILSAFFGILRQTTQRTEGFFLPYLYPNSGYGQFINRNHFAFLMEMALGLALGLVVGWRSVKREKLLIYLALAMPVWAALILCNSRGGIFAMLAQVLFLAVLYAFAKSGSENSRREELAGGFLSRMARTAAFRFILVAGLVCTVFIGALWLGGESLTSRLETVSSEVEATGGRERTQRSEIWRTTWKMIKDHPLLGVGINGYWMAVTQYHDASGEATPQQAHNDHLELLASAGVIGVALALWFLFLLIKGARRTFRSHDAFRRGAALGASAGLFGVAAHSTVDFGLHVTINALVLMALVSLAVMGAGRAEMREGP
jgi:putative inorganic carbon (hco3(-)) transporter